MNTKIKEYEIILNDNALGEITVYDKEKSAVDLKYYYKVKIDYWNWSEYKYFEARKEALWYAERLIKSVRFCEKTYTKEALYKN